MPAMFLFTLLFLITARVCRKKPELRYLILFTTKDVGQGKGLGLSAVYGSIMNHDGIINCDSTLNNGCKFEIYLPLKNQVSELNTIKEQPLNIINSEKTFLLIDDEDIVRKYTKALFEKQEYDVTTYSNPIKALEHYTNHWRKYDFVILDIIMPSMNGKELFKELKLINLGIKAILTTGFGGESETNEMFKQGIIAKLEKPYTVEQLESEILV